MRSNLKLGAVSALCAGSLWLCAHLYNQLQDTYEQSGALSDTEYSWLFRLLINLVGYSIVMVPGFILYKYLQMSNYFDKISNKSPSCVSRALVLCFGPHERLPEGAGAGVGEGAEEGDAGAGWGRGAELAYCCCGLMGSYLVWGLLQEKIMTQEYRLRGGGKARFGDAGLLVLANRAGALLAALTSLRCERTPPPHAPLYRFSYCALSNVLSAWCQYEALNYVSFPTQVLSKSCKVIPVMVMGKLISRNKYCTYEYATAALISLGMVMFMVGSAAEPGSAAAGAGAAGGLGGAALLALYLCCDSFTSSWQAALFRQHALHPLQMLAAVNLCSVALTAAPLLRRGPNPRTLALLQEPTFLADCLALSVSSAVGQLLIYRTIAGFGAVVFAIIMTLRQAVSILISCAVYGHGVSAGGAAGVTLVFAAALLRVHYARRVRVPRDKPPPQ